MPVGLLTGKRVLITAGPTREAIDPVRFISNHSSGKMGYAIAEEFLRQGAEVILISGPVSISLQHPRLTLVKVESATEMYLACCQHFEECTVAVFCAAVADYRPRIVASKKIKKEQSNLKIELVKNIDIAGELGRNKAQGQITVGFALETDNELEHAMVKLRRKNLDIIILNSMNDTNATFGYDTNKITIINSKLELKESPLNLKSKLAVEIVKEICQQLHSPNVSHFPVNEMESKMREAI